MGYQDRPGAVIAGWHGDLYGDSYRLLPDGSRGVLVQTARENWASAYPDEAARVEARRQRVQASVAAIKADTRALCVRGGESSRHRLSTCRYVDTEGPGGKCSAWHCPPLPPKADPEAPDSAWETVAIFDFGEDAEG